VAYYEVKIVRHEWKKFWYEYWDTKNEPSKRSKELGEQDHLGITHIVTAKTKAEAEAKVLRDNPGFVAISEDTRRLR